MAPQEQTKVFSSTAVEILQAVHPGLYVRPRGEDIRAGQRVLEAGTRLAAAEIGVLAALGQAWVPVHLRPRVALLSTGSELLDAAEPLLPGRIRDSNAPALAALVEENGASVHMALRAADRREELHAALDHMVHADLLLTIGGVSVGDYDLVRPVVEERGEVAFWRIAMKPGKPLLFAQVDGKPLLGLPGNPVSSMVIFEKFVRPVLWRMQGRRALGRPRVPVHLSHDYQSTAEREEYVRARTCWTPQGFVATPTGSQGSGRLSSMVGANSLVVIPMGVAAVTPETLLEAELIGPLTSEEG